MPDPETGSTQHSMQDLTLTLIQSPLYWQDSVANLAMLEEKMAPLAGSQDIIILPEMFSTGFSMNPETLAEPPGLTTERWLKLQAARTGSVVTGSYILRDQGKYYNRLIWMRPDGTSDYYDKRHLFRMAEEHDVYSPGNEKLITEINGWRICPLICYDLRFPVWSRNTMQDGSTLAYDLLLYVANWPAPRHTAWTALLKARAIENLAYCAGVNRIGEDGNGIAYAGGSAVYDMKGAVLADLREEDKMMTVVLQGEKLIAYRKKFPAWMDADDFQIRH